MHRFIIPLSILLLLNLNFSLAAAAATAAAAEEEAKEAKDHKESKDAKDHKDHKEVKEAKDHKEAKDPKDAETADSEISQILSGVGYPELQVVPRASERLGMEAKNERYNWYYQYWQFQVSGLATLFAATAVKSNLRDDLSDKQKTDAQTLTLLSQGLGASWLIGGLVLGFSSPYSQGYRSISKYKGKDERSELLRERLAEESIEGIAGNSRLLRYVSTFTNLAASAAVLDYGKDNAKAIAGVSVLLAFLPLILQDHAIGVAEKHIEYKKKIYAPLKTTSLGYDPTSREFYPVTNLLWQF
jgi:hypothetical protein